MDSSATNQKVSWFRREEVAGNLDISPKFQRRPVWSEEQASYLIDTILSGLPIPEIYIRSSSTPKGEVHYEVVDGQQRIRAVLLFGSNDLELSGSNVGVQWTGKMFEDLSEVQQTAFWDYKIVVRDVSGASDLEIRDLFQRLNIHSVVLNDQELRHARHSGKFIQAMERLADDEWWLDTGIVSVRQIRRMEDVEYISELFVGLAAGPQDKKKNLDDYYANFDAAMPLEREWVEKFEETRDFIKGLLSPSEQRRWNGKSDFYTLFLAMAPVAAQRPRLSGAQKLALAGVLSNFRTQVDLAKRKDNQTDYGAEVNEYVEAVARAATDLGRRETRLRVLESVVQRALTAKAGGKKK